MPKITSQTPYNDDFNESKNYHKILFRPGYAVQARELTQLQSILESQLSHHGRSQFHNGDAVLGGQTAFLRDVEHIKVYDHIGAGNDNTSAKLDLSDLFNTTTGRGVVISKGEHTKGQRDSRRKPRATVMAVVENNGSDPATLIVQYANSWRFMAGDAIVVSNIPLETSDPDHIVVARVRDENYGGDPTPTGPASLFTVEPGIYFIDSTFIRTPRQSIVLGKYTDRPTYAIGFIKSDEIVTDADDSTLLDNASESYNVNSPGAHRLKTSIKLAVHPLSDGITLPSAGAVGFHTIFKIANGVPIIEDITTQNSEFLNLLAERTHDESGNYSTVPFRVDVLEGATSSIIASSAELQSVVTGLAQNDDDITQTTAPEGGTQYGPKGKGKKRGGRRGGAGFRRLQQAFNAFSVTQPTEADKSNFSVKINPGTAYVKGYKTRLNEPLILTAPKARTTKTGVANNNLGFGLYFKIKDPSEPGLWNVSNLEVVNFHLGNVASLTSQQVKDSTRIGQARVTDMQVKTFPEGEAETVYYHLHMLDMRTTPIQNTAGESDSTSIICSNLTPTDTNQYVGGYIKMIGGPANNEVRRIVGSTTGGVINVIPAFSTTPTGTGAGFGNNFQITFDSSFVGCIANTVVDSAMADVANVGKVGTVSTGETILYGRNQTKNYVPIGPEVISSIDGVSYDIVYRDSQTPAGAVVNFPRRNVNETISTNDNDHIFTGGPGASGILSPVSVDSDGSGGIDVTFGVSPGTDVIGILRAKTNTLARQLFSNIQGPRSNTDVVSGAAGAVSLNDTLQTARGIGLVVIDTPNLITSGLDNLGIPNVYNIHKIIDTGDIGTPPAWNGDVWDATRSRHSDVTSNYVLDSGQRDSHFDYSSIRLKPNVTPPGGQLLVLCDFLEPPLGGTVPQSGFFDVESYVGAIAYDDIPVYEDSSGIRSRLQNVMDFRPVRKANNVVGSPVDISINQPFHNTKRFPKVDGVLDIDEASHFLSRIDHIVLTSTGRFQHISGVPSDFPVPPENDDDNLLLSTLRVPAYTFSYKDIIIDPAENKRKTMKDINKVARRVDRLEYFTSLNLLEKQAADMNIIDSTGAYTRFKSGILVDNFTGHGVESQSAGDYGCSMDRARRELRPAFTMREFRFNFDAINSQTTRRTGEIVTLNWTPVEWQKQLAATHAISPNPFSLKSYFGTLILQPTEDVWFETRHKDPVVFNLAGDNDNLEFLVEHLNNNLPIGTDWDQWETNWLGVNEATNVEFGVGSYVGSWSRRHWNNETVTTTDTHFGVMTRQGIEHNFTVENTTTSLGNRVVDSSIIPHMRQKGVFFKARGLEPNSSNRVYFDGEDVSVNCARANEIFVNPVVGGIPFIADGPWPDNAAAIGEYRPNGGLFQEVIQTSTTSEGDAAGRVVSAVGNTIHIVTANGVFVPGDELIGESLATGVPSPAVTVASYKHYSGFCRAANSTSITLEEAANAAIGFLSNEEADGTINFIGAADIADEIKDRAISIISGTGVGQTRKVLGYDPATREVVFDQEYSVTPLGAATQSVVDPAVTSAYSIGEKLNSALTNDNNDGSPFTASDAGIATGVFVIPADTFYAGEKTFMIRAVVPGGSLASETISTAQASFYAQGILQTVEEISVQTQSIGTASHVVTESQDITQDVTRTENTGRLVVTGYYDPLAQTFLCDAQDHPDGIFVSDIDLFFASKPTTQEEITCEIRLATDGTPSATQILASKTLYPGDVVITADANPDSPTKFEFSTPVHLEPGKEYAMVIRTNDVSADDGEGENYTLWIASGEPVTNETTGEIFIREIVGNAEETYAPTSTLGMLFKSQNTTTWTENQYEDLMFRINRCSFETGSGIANFKNSIDIGLLDAYGQTAVIDQSFDYDVLNIQSHDAFFPETSVEYDFSGLIEETGTTSATVSIPANRNLYLDQRLRVNSLADGSLLVGATLTGITDEVSPFIRIPGLHAITVQNFVNNAELSNSHFRIVEGGTTYSNTDIMEIQSNRTGTPTIDAFHVNTNPAGNVVAIWANTEAGFLNANPYPGGYGFFDNPNTDIITTSTGSGAVVVYDGETGISGGNVIARYSTREVTLNPEFSAKDLQVFLTAHRPSGTNVQVYYKITNSNDPERFLDKNWVLMDLETSEASATSSSGETADYWKELKFIPFGHANDLEFPMKYDSAEGHTHTTFNSFAIKICLSATKHTQVPLVRALRAIALD